MSWVARKKWDFRLYGKFPQKDGNDFLTTSGVIFVHSSYLSHPPQPAVVYFFLAGVLFSIENTKCWPNLANFDQFWLFCCEFTEFFGVLFIDLNNAAVY